MRSAQVRMIAAALSFFVWPHLLQAAGAPKPLTLGVHPYLAATDLYKRFMPLAEHLGRKTGRPVTLVIARDYQEHIDNIGKGKIDLAYMGPASYVKMVDTYGKKTILGRFETKGKPAFYGIIFVARASPIRGLADLRGKRFAFGDHNSTMSHLVPVYMMWKAGVTIDQLAGYEFLGKHENVALGVLSGAFDAGAVKEETYYQYEDRGLRVLARTPDFSEHVLVADSKLPEKTVRTVRKALYELGKSDEGRAILTAIKEDTTGISAADDSNYDNLREVLRQLEQLGIK